MDTVRQRRLTWLLAFGQVAVLTGLALYPINAIMVRVTLLVLLLTLWLTVLALGWVRRPLRYVVAAVPLIVAIVLVLPARNVDSADLRRRILAALRQYEGVTYIWGGENGFGIDCSGLVRRARMDAEWSYGFAHADPGAFRRALSLWWHDQSALAMGQQDRGTTVVMSSVPSLATCPADRYQAGDFAILGGVHVVAALGDGVWIEADPLRGQVLVLPPGSDNSWLTSPATLVRWQVLVAPQ